MDVNIANIPVSLGNGENVYVSLRWFRGASRYNNGGTIHKGVHQMRLILGRVKHKRQVPFFEQGGPHNSIHLQYFFLAVTASETPSSAALE